LQSLSLSFQIILKAQNFISSVNFLHSFLTSHKIKCRFVALETDH
jgi:hypothetical protein